MARDHSLEEIYLWFSYAVLGWNQLSGLCVTRERRVFSGFRPTHWAFKTYFGSNLVPTSLLADDITTDFV